MLPRKPNGQIDYEELDRLLFLDWLYRTGGRCRVDVTTDLDIYAKPLDMSANESWFEGKPIIEVKAKKQQQPVLIAPPHPKSFIYLQVLVSYRLLSATKFIFPLARWIYILIFGLS